MADQQQRQQRRRRPPAAGQQAQEKAKSARLDAVVVARDRDAEMERTE